jgi:beta-lactamase class A
VDKADSWKKWFWILVTLSVIAGGWLFVWRDNSIAEFKNEYPLLDPARNFIAQEDFIVNLQPLREELKKMVSGRPALQISLYFEFLNTGANIAINPDINIWPASLPKVPMAMAVMKKVEDGDWSINKKFELTEQDKDPRYGNLFNSPVGREFSLEDLLRETLVYSDNTAYQIFLRSVTGKDLDKIVEQMGLDDLFTDSGLVSAKEYSRLFRALYTSSFLKREYSELILNFLGKAKFDDFIVKSLPEEVVYAHKFGIDRTEHAYLDSGIVYAENRPYLISVAIQGKGVAGEEAEVGEFMREVGSKIYEYVSEY